MNQIMIKLINMKKLLDLLFKDKAPEDRPSKVEIKLKSTITPEERLTEDQWKAEYRIGIAVENREGIHNAHSIMQFWDEQKQINYYKNLKLNQNA
jgi:hypothetical protein